MKRNKLLFFSGNRAEFGYLLPFFIELHKNHDIDFVVSGTHLLPPWNSIVEIKDSINKYKLNIELKKIELKNTKNAHIKSFTTIHDKTVNLLESKEYDYAFVLGDRPESLAFASAIFLHNTPLIHYAGGDITDNAYLDSNIRHVITKMSHLHLTLSQDAKKVVQQLGEEPWRVHNIGISTYDYDRLGLLPTKDTLRAKFLNIDFSNYILIVTYHATQYKSSEDNYIDFKELLEALKTFGLPIIMTYPNNDTGSTKIIEYLENNNFNKNIKIVKNLGTLNLLSLYKNFKSIVVGNSSGGLLETALYKTPTLNIGDRQGNRKRADNVFNVNLKDASLKKGLFYILENYEKIQTDCEKNRGIFGFGNSTEILRELIEDKNYKKEKIMLKKFFNIKN